MGWKFDGNVTSLSVLQAAAMESGVFCDVMWLSYKGMDQE